MRVAVIGSRTFSDKTRLYEVLTKNLPKIKIIVSGGARGADTLATDWATDYGVPYLVFPALWRDPFTLAHDKGAGFRRNRYIVDHSDYIIAFWDGVSGGTKHTIDMAKEAGKTVKIIEFTPPPPPPLPTVPETEKEIIKRHIETTEADKVRDEALKAQATTPQAIASSGSEDDNTI